MDYKKAAELATAYVLESLTEDQRQILNALAEDVMSGPLYRLDVLAALAEGFTRADIAAATSYRLRLSDGTIVRCADWGSGLPASSVYGLLQREAERFTRDLPAVLYVDSDFENVVEDEPEAQPCAECGGAETEDGAEPCPDCMGLGGYEPGEYYAVELRDTLMIFKEAQLI